MSYTLIFPLSHHSWKLLPHKDTPQNQSHHRALCQMYWIFWGTRVVEHTGQTQMISTRWYVVMSDNLNVAIRKKKHLSECRRRNRSLSVATINKCRNLTTLTTVVATLIWSKWFGRSEPKRIKLWFQFLHLRCIVHTNSCIVGREWRRGRLIAHDSTGG